MLKPHPHQISLARVSAWNQVAKAGSRHAAHQRAVPLPGTPTHPPPPSPGSHIFYRKTDPKPLSQGRELYGPVPVKTETFREL